MGDTEAGGTAPSGNEPTGETTARAEGGTVKERSWHRYSEEFAAANTSENARYSVKQLHDRITKGCGHDLKIGFDWPTFKMAEWVDVRPGKGGSGNILHDEAAAGACVAEILEAFADMCDDPKAADYKPALSKIKTMTCHSKPCDSLPRATHLQGETNPGDEYVLTDNKTHLDKSYCQLTIMMEDWIDRDGYHRSYPWKFLEDNL